MVSETIYADEQAEAKIKMLEREEKEKMRLSETYAEAQKFWSSPQGLKAIKEAR